MFTGPQIARFDMLSGALPRLAVVAIGLFPVGAPLCEQKTAKVVGICKRLSQRGGGILKFFSQISWPHGRFVISKGRTFIGRSQTTPCPSEPLPMANISKKTIEAVICQWTEDMRTAAQIRALELGFLDAAEYIQALARDFAEDPGFWEFLASDSGKYDDDGQDDFVRRYMNS